MKLARCLLVGVFLLLAGGAQAHESRPAYLEIDETAPGRYDVLFRTPVLAGVRLPITLRFPDGARNLTEPRLQELADSLIERRLVEVDGGIAGKRIDFAGLQLTITDVLARVQLRDGAYTTTLGHPSQPWLEVVAAPGVLAVAGAYLRHGIDHILLGYDHLLFVFALILIVRGTRRLLWTITAFTLAHSITLALATLGVVHVPGPPVEATIALSIILLACEIVRLQRGEGSLTARWPSGPGSRGRSGLTHDRSRPTRSASSRPSGSSSGWWGSGCRRREGQIDGNRLGVRRTTAMRPLCR